MHKPTPEEDLSALLDDALGRHECDALLERLREAPQARACLARYSLIGMAMRGEIDDIPKHDLTLPIMARIRAEEPVLPGPRLNPSRWHGGLGRWRMPALGMALAASLAGVAVLVIPSGQPTPDAGLVASNTAETAPEAPETSSTQLASQDNEGMPDPYLIQHLTHAEGGPVNAMASYVRLVADDRP